MSARGQAQGAARRAQHSTGLRALARGGYAASGVVHLLIGWLAVRLALGSSSGSADESGAFQQLASAPGGTVALWAVTLGFAALALWQLAEAAVGVPGVEDAKEAAARVKAAGKGVLYGVLAFSAARYATGDGGGGGQQESLTAKLMQAPAGRWLVVAVGLVIVGVGVFHVVKGWRKKFLEDLRGTGGGSVGAAVVRLGQIGYVAKGVALGVLGGLFVAAGATHDAEKAGGLDDALQAIREQPFGTVLLVVTGVGIAAYGVYSFARARYAKL
ncbi:uncharacterized protein DUF1206 [Isoptericola sp. CG 20/1183]|uniref:Uncharacterized protein DUF1206 n=1 Tax=Isoptericola halotolerans TaxID=300560 RepID=A0ABX5EKP0_9MICO|nr:MULTISPECIES: DUF1206 domain-containing protein [Isoptericola]PRZ09444.1 uncharacterized protein DUF1206 [Isoptericola sp. CG 20/1183]PRZ10245.1 uncharacterized protein DUF1206 [Isoptericola halotolerans]